MYIWGVSERVAPFLCHQHSFLFLIVRSIVSIVSSGILNGFQPRLFSFNRFYGIWNKTMFGIYRFSMTARPLVARQQVPSSSVFLQQTAEFSKYISKARAKRLPLTTKKAGKGYYKGNGSRKEGYITSKGMSKPTASGAVRWQEAFVILNILSACIHRKVHPSSRHGDWTCDSRFLTVQAEALRGSRSAAKQGWRLSQSLLISKSWSSFPSAGVPTTQTLQHCFPVNF